MSALTTISITKSPSGLMGLTSGEVIFVNTTGSDGSSGSIQEAIDTADAGDTIFVYRGSYRENLVINKSINLTGEDRDNTIIDGDDNGDVITVNADNVNVTGFRIIGAGDWGFYSGDGISLNNVQNCRIQNNNISGIKDGIYLIDSEGNEIISNIINGGQSHGHEDGINLYQSSDNNVTGNTVSSFNIGIKVSGSANHIMNNEISSNRIGLYVHGGDFSYVRDNHLEHNENAISLAYSDGCNITKNTVTYFNEGISFRDSNWNSITENELVSGLYGAYLESSSNNKVFHNDFLGCGYWLEGASENNLFNESYPSGGNYWYSYQGVDTFNGPNQDISGSDGIGDTNNGIDQYPLINPRNSKHTRPTEPLNVTATGRTNHIHITWSPPAYEGNYPVRNYRIYRSDISGEEIFLREIDNILFYNDTSVSINVVYYYRISSMNVVGESPLSDTVNGTGFTDEETPSEDEDFPLCCLTAIVIIIILAILVIYNYIRQSKKEQS